MKKYCLVSFALLFLTLSGHTQNKGLKAPEGGQAEPVDTGKIYALVAGISKYDDPNMPPLNYADSDAIYFYRILRAGALGKTDSADIHLLINSDVTEANFRKETYAIS